MRVLGDPLARGFGGLALGMQGSVESFTTLLSSLAPALSLRFNETSGTAVINYGTAGAVLNGTWTPGAAGAQGAVGKVGPAYDFDGALSKVVVANNAAINIPTFTDLALLKFDSSGGGNLGRVLDYNSQENWLIQGNRTLDSQVVGTGNAQSTSSTVLAYATWYLLFRTFDNTGDRKIHLYVGQNGAVTEVAYTTQNAMTGTMTSKSGNLTIGNSAGNTRGFDGLYDEFARLPVILSTTTMGRLVQVAGI